MDNFQPLLLNDSNDGGDWKMHGIKKTQVKKRHASTEAGSKAIGEYSMRLIEENAKKGNIKDDE